MEGELDQLKEEKESLEASGLSGAGLGVASSVSGLPKGASAGQVHPKRKRRVNKRNNLACHWKKGRSTIRHNYHTCSTDTVMVLLI